MSARRAGRITVAVALVALGLALLLDNTSGTAYTGLVLRLWPLLLIGAGVEYLILGALARDGGGRIRLDWGGLIVIFLVGLIVGQPFWSPGWWGRALSFDHMVVVNGHALTGMYAGQISKEIPITGVEKLISRSGYARVEVVPGAAGGAIRVTADVRVRGATDAEARANFERVVLDVAGGRTSRVELVPPSGIYVESAALRIEVPPLPIALEAESGSGGIRVLGIRGDVIVRGGSGHVLVEDVGGHLDARVASGGLEASRIGGNAVVEGSSGAVRLRGVGGRVTVQGGSGGVTVQGAAGDVEARGGSGIIRVEDPGARVTARGGSGGVDVRSAGPVAGDWDLRGTSGGVSAFFPANSDVQLTATSSSGGITAPSWAFGDRRSARGTLNRGTYRVNLEAGSGGIRVGH